MTSLQLDRTVLVLKPKLVLLILIDVNAENWSPR